jgi:two-component system chemotaxis response regulator CheB
LSVTVHNHHSAAFEAVVIVSSFGGYEPLRRVLGALPASFPASVLVYRHAPAGDDPDRLTRLLRRGPLLDVQTGANGERCGRRITVVPTGSAATLERNHRLGLEAGSVVNGGNILLASAASAFGATLLAVILSGLRRDGTLGVRAVKRAGGRVLAQDPATALAPDMPASAIATGCVDFVLPPERIGPAIVALTMAPGAAPYLYVPTPHWANLTG